MKKESLVKINSKENLLTKSQITFNKLIKDIKYISESNIILNNHLENISQLYSKSIIPEIQKFSREKITIIKLIYEATNKVKISKRRIEFLRNYMIASLLESFNFIEPQKDDIELYNLISNSDYFKDQKKNENDLKKDFADDLFDIFGIEIDMDELDSSPEKQAELFEKIKKQAEENNGKTKEKKSKKQITREAKENEVETEKLKSIRSIYMTLVKLLHPDGEINENIKFEKEEIMKQVTVAYQAKDLSQLLKIEMQWVANAQDELQNMHDKKLQLYIKALKEQLNDLKNEKWQIINNPRFDKISQFEKSKIEIVQKAFEIEIKKINYSINDLKKQHILLNSKEAKDILIGIADHQKELEDNEWANYF